MRPKPLILLICACGLCPEPSKGQATGSATCPLGYHKTPAKDCESDDHLQRIRPAYGERCRPGEQLEEMLTLSAE